jgi:membrane-anchored mycosin MYCP
MPSITHQIVVATEHLRLVEEVLTWAGLEPTSDRHVERLGLSLVDLGLDTNRLERAAVKLWEVVPEEERTALDSTREPGLDPLLASLRDRFRHLYSGWTPTMGKNRLMHGIELLPYASVVGFEVPEPVDRPAGVSEGRPEVPQTDPPLRRARVGVIDVRLAPHRRLEGAYLADRDGLDLRTEGQTRQGWQGHATFVANVILSVAPSAELVVRTPLLELPEQEVDPKRPDDRWRMPLWDFAERLIEFADDGVQVLNCSMGCETFDGRPPLVLERAIAHLSPTMVIVAGAGNHGLPELTTAPYVVAESGDRNAALFPAALDGVLAVGALDSNGDVADFNPKGADDEGWAPWIDGFCRGGDVISAFLGDRAEEMVELPPEPGQKGAPLVPFNGWARWTGTSFAAAHATGRIAALIARGRSPADALAEVRNDPGFTQL